MKTIINGRQKDDNHEIYSKYQNSLISIIASQSLLRAVEIAKSALNEQKVVYDDELSVGEYWVGKLREKEDENEMYKKEIAKLEHDLAEIERLQAQVENRDAMIERLITAIESGSGIRLRPRANVSAISLWWLAMNKVISELKTMKGGGK